MTDTKLSRLKRIPLVRMPCVTSGNFLAHRFPQNSRVRRASLALLAEECPERSLQLRGLEQAHDHLGDNRKARIEEEHEEADARPIAGNHITQQRLQREQRGHMRNEDEQRMASKERNDSTTRETPGDLKDEPGVRNVKEGDTRRTRQCHGRASHTQQNSGRGRPHRAQPGACQKSRR